MRPLKAVYLKTRFSKRWRRHAAQCAAVQFRQLGPSMAAAFRDRDMIEPVDQIVVEYPVTYRRYNAKTEWTIIFGRPADAQRRMYDAARKTLDAMTEIARPRHDARRDLRCPCQGPGWRRLCGPSLWRDRLFCRLHLRAHQHGRAADDLCRQRHDLRAGHDAFLSRHDRRQRHWLWHGRRPHTAW